MAREIVSDLLADLDSESTRLDLIDRYMRGKHDGPYTPRTATAEYKLLAQRSVTNILPLIVNGVAQSLYVEGYRNSVTGAQAPGWRWWQHNGMDGAQVPIHRAAISYGIAYATVLPGELVDGVAAPVMRGFGPRRMIAVYDDPVHDEWPVYALDSGVVTLADGSRRRRARLYDDKSVTEFHAEPSAGEFEEISVTPHPAGVCPVVAYRCVPDLEGRTTGEVEPYIPLQDRLNQTIFDLLVAQTYSSFKVRTATGLTPSLDSDGKPKPLPIDAARLLMAKDPDTKFGQLDESNLGQLIDSADATIRHIAVISQTPPQDLLGKLANLSAEALTAARDGQNRKRTEMQYGLGESHEQLSRLFCRVAGDEAGWLDRSAQVTWRDVEGRSLAQVADALGKLATMLDVPVEALWSRIPGTTQTDVENWTRLRATARASEPLALLADHVAGAAQGVSGGTVNDRNPANGNPPG